MARTLRQALSDAGNCIASLSAEIIVLKHDRERLTAENERLKRHLTASVPNTARLITENKQMRAALTQFVAACDTAPPISLMQEIAIARKVAGEVLSQQLTVNSEEGK